MLTADQIKSQATSLGFDLCGISAVDDWSPLTFLDEWLQKGYAGEMHYMSRTASQRADVRRVVPSARSVISLGTVYNTDRPYSIEQTDSGEANISRYAWGDDYHNIVGARTNALLKWMRTVHDGPFDARPYVDTGPVQERVYAQQAGLGWIGKNTCVINSEIGSWFFLSEIICSLPLTPDIPALDQCGTCNLCLEACPTDAIVEPWVLDATKCISYITIELKNEVPESERRSVGANVYGCDICQDVCPWNATASQTSDECWQPHSAFDRPRLTQLWRESDDSLGPIVSSSAMSYTGLTRLRRNMAMALGNSMLHEAAVALGESTLDESKQGSLVSEHVVWARNRIRQAKDGNQKR